MNVNERLSRTRFLTIKPDLSGMSTNEILALKSAVRAARKMTDVYLEQVAPGNRELYERLSQGAQSEHELFQLMRVNGAPWDTDDHDAPFIEGVGSRPPGAGMYPLGLTSEHWAAALAAAEPAVRDALQSPYTLVRGDSKGLEAVPYSQAYAGHLQEAAEHLKTAAALLPRGPLEQFLRLRADAFGTNNYDPSDRAWIGTDGTPFELTIGPYEVYFDRLAGLKASYEAFVGIPDRQANEALAKFGPEVPAVDAMLAERYGFRPSGGARPLEVVSDVFRGGEAAFGYVFVAYNLPNDRRIRTEVGSKNVFSATLMQAKFDHLTRPLVDRTFMHEGLDAVTFNSRLLFVLAHELAHGIGPSTITVDGRAVPFEHSMGPLHSAIEEAKADMLGAVLLAHFAKNGLLTDDQVESCVITEVSDYLRHWRGGFREAHSKGHLMQFNWLMERGAAGYDKGARRIWVQPRLALASMEDLAHEFIGLQLSGDRANAERFVERWTTVPDGIEELLGGLADLPIRVLPIYDI